jgi:N,N'-diacetyllegionaminate synthase
MSKIYTIAEIGQAHEGSLGMAHAYIDALNPTGVDAVKFQVHIAEAESSIHEPFRLKLSSQDATRLDYWKRMEFTRDQWNELKKHCEDTGLDFIASPFSNLAVSLLQAIGTEKYKVGSGEINNMLLMKRLAETKKEIILSSGMSSLSELDDTIRFMKTQQNKLSLLQCTTAYPTHPTQWGLNVIDVFKKRYNLPIGFSDHSGDIFACVAAACAGAEILEFHTVFDKRMYGPDTNSSITMDQVKMLVKGVRDIEIAFQNPCDKADTTDFEEVKSIFEKSLAVNKNKFKGERLHYEDLEAIKPRGFGISPQRYAQIIGKRLSIDLKQWDFITENALYEA